MMSARGACLMLAFSILLAAILLSGCNGKVPTPGPDTVSLDPTPLHSKKGVSLSPRSYNQSGFEEFFALTRQTGRIVTWAGDWDQLDTPGMGPGYVTSMSSEYGYEPVLIATYYSQSEGRMLRPLDEATEQRYLEKVSAYAKGRKPEYLGLGIEVNIMAEQSPGDFEEFVSFYSRAYDAIKAASPETKVFTVFQLERMKGLHGGLFGGSDDPEKAQWGLISRFDKSDMIAFTTYPCLIYKDPADIPADYYSDIRTYTDKPIAFTEIGWYSGTPAPGWESSEAEQARFVRTFFDTTAGTDPQLLIWSFMYDPQVPEPFTTIGLRRADGGEKPAWGEWTRA